MDFLASVGLLVIIFSLVKIGLRYASNQETVAVKNEYYSGDSYIEKVKTRYFERYGEFPDRVDYKKLIPYSQQCQIILHEHNNPKIQNFSQVYPSSKLKKALSNPLVFWEAIDKYLDKIEGEDRIRERLKVEQEISKKYYLIIYTIFCPKKYTDSNHIVKKFNNIFNYDFEKSWELIDLLEENSLIKKIGNSDYNTYIEEVNDMGQDVIFIIANDMIIELMESGLIPTYYQWLKDNNTDLIDNWDVYFKDNPDN
jgi:hypothetical protein